MSSPVVDGLPTRSTPDGGHECNAWCDGDLHCGVLYTPATSSIDPWLGRRLMKGSRGFMIKRYEPASNECKPHEGRPPRYDQAWLTWWRYVD